ncbi:TRAP transporter large permease subunit [Nocardioides seonyuensis]|uniref:TRAP transporter large permease subunit n=1 Tax=Nocardioides seonyuensis TaxID=2518371 RepID=A0A4P7IFD5_9ACTN|nr:TRAP transporter large permease subunit [Nocardioides seonyuensis]QBX55946.1 TRAP transporter large permease subunit [Nocardioides seonyuensis]
MDDLATVTRPVEPAVTTQPGRRHLSRLVVVVGYVLPVLLGWLMLGGDLERTQIGFLVIAMMLSLLFLKVPIAAAMGLSGLLGIWGIRSFDTAAAAVKNLPYTNAASWSLSVLPAFIFMGVILWRSGATARIYGSAKMWLSWLPGGLAIGTNVAGAGLGSVSGSTIGVSYSLGRIGIPEMLRAGYDRRLAIGSVMMAGTAANLIPPSIMMVLFAGIATVPVGPQLLAGLIPGLMLPVAYSIVILVLYPVLTRRKTVAADEVIESSEVTLVDRLRSLPPLWPFPLLFLVVVGGLFGGVFTPTEAGAAGALTALAAALVISKRGDRLKMVVTAATEAVASTGAIFMLIIGAVILNQALTLTGITQDMIRGIEGLGLSFWPFIALLIAIYLILGMFMDPLMMMLITVPLIVPILPEYGLSVMWLGVFVVLVAEIGLVTPPVGMLTYIMHKLAQKEEVNLGQRITLGDTFQAVLWFMPATVVVVIVIAGFPDIVHWLPDISSSK